MIVSVDSVLELEFIMCSHLGIVRMLRRGGLTCDFLGVVLGGVAIVIVIWEVVVVVTLIVSAAIMIMVGERDGY